MIDFIPASIYYPIYINFCFFLVVLSLFHTWVLKIEAPKNISFINAAGYFLLMAIIIYMGQRPIYAVFGDTVNYNFFYNKYAKGSGIGKNVGDYGWHVFMKFMSGVASVHTFFTIVAIIYIYPMYRISIQLFNKFWYYSFVLFIVSFSFWTYGVNGMRNGAALSLFLWGVSYRHNKVVMGLLFFAATLFHKTALLPIFAYLVTYFYNHPKVFLKAWLLCIPVSLATGSIWVSLFASIGFGDDDRLAGYLTTQAEAGTFASTGFRWDFLFHSAFAVFAAWYFIYKKNFNDSFYNQLVNTYLICNGFWILVITANYSNRFAYLSWFMMAIVIIYPFLKGHFFKNQHFMIGKVMFVYFFFTYFMYYLYSG
ncbi:MAG: hypothetical protein CO117_15205 [Flavobacteriaceae bacterium CG_4_9_14_3_um_filter_33_16]|nr:MAG: hypothetical protein CO117_15205 [Flavobacteriaceae bacterium CG_4_9_14_3_um_filter_33_16]